MAIPQLTPEQITQVSGLVCRYITTQREKYAPRAIALSAQQRAAMDGFFSPQLLESTRVLVLQGERVVNPDFYPMLRSLGFQQSARSIGDGSDYVLRCSGVARGVLEWTVVS